MNEQFTLESSLTKFMPEAAEENLAELTAQAQTFADKRLPILKALQIV